jgi:hypothetical protein
MAALNGALWVDGDAERGYMEPNAAYPNSSAYALRRRRSGTVANPVGGLALADLGLS